MGHAVFRRTLQMYCIKLTSALLAPPAGLLSLVWYSAYTYHDAHAHMWACAAKDRLVAVCDVHPELCVKSASRGQTLCQACWKCEVGRLAAMA